MRIKSYFSKSVEAAILEARKDLGEEAMLVTSRRASPENSHLGEYEVVFGTTANAGEAPAAASPAQKTQRVVAGGDDLYQELRAVRSQLDEIRHQLNSAEGFAPGGVERAKVYEALIT